MRKAGILMPVSSLPSRYGIGSLGRAAFDFVDFLAEAGQSIWQILPVGPTSYGDSPYSAVSAFAGNPYFIDLDILVGNGLVYPDELDDDWGRDETRVDYKLLFDKRYEVLSKACARQNKTSRRYLAFCEENAFWLDDYAAYMAIKEAQGWRGFAEWPEQLRRREPAAMRVAEARFGPRMEFWRCVQFFFWEQWRALKTYANAAGIEIVGDLPIYVSADSSDVWAHPELFQTNPDGSLAAVAGVPPDAFSAEGQLWGNPLYDWKYHKRTRYEWWIQRMRYSGQLYDIIRIDHFRGFAGYFSIPADAETAAVGEWKPGPGKSLIRALRRALPDLKIIAEDLGFLTEEVFELLVYSSYPGMKILQFAFDSRDESDYLPHNYPRHTVVYTGTHDNTTLKDWQVSALPDDVAFARRYLGLVDKQSLPAAMIRAALSSVGNVAIVPLPDWLGLGIRGRINVPSTVGGRNWQWRVREGQLTPALSAHIRNLTMMYGRLSVAERAKEGLAARIAGTSSLVEKAMASAAAKAEEKAALLPPAYTDMDEKDQQAALQAGLPPSPEASLHAPEGEGNEDSHSR